MTRGSKQSSFGLFARSARPDAARVASPRGAAWRGLLALSLSLTGASMACERGVAPSAARPSPRQEELPVLGVLQQLRCAPLGAAERESETTSLRAQACRVLREFAEAPSFSRWPEAGATDIWLGRQFQHPPTRETEDVGSFLLVRVSPGAPSPSLAANYRLRPEDLEPYQLRDLPFTRLANPSAAVQGVERARQEGAWVRATLAALARDEAPNTEALAWLRGFESDPAGFAQLRGPAAVVHTTGPSLRAYPGLYGYLRGSRDGRRMLVAFPNGAAELWRLPR